MKIALVEDENLISSFLKKGLTAAGYSVEIFDRGDTAAQQIPYLQPDLVLLDIMLPGKDGLEVLKEIRRWNLEVPVILLTARGSTDDKVTGLDSGANDYLAKPFAFSELLARIRAQLRSHTNTQERSDELVAGDLKLLLGSHQLERQENLYDLSSREFSLLHHFFSNPGKILTRQQLLDGVWDYSYDARSNVIDVYMRTLRKILSDTGSDVTIKTVRGVGYRLEV